MRSRMKCKPLPSTDKPFTRDEFERVEREYPTASDADKFRLMQAQRLIDQNEQVRSQQRTTR